MRDFSDLFDVILNGRPGPNNIDNAATERAKIFRYLIDTGKTHIRYNGKIYAVTTKLVETTEEKRERDPKMNLLKTPEEALEMVRILLSFDRPVNFEKIVKQLRDELNRIGYPVNNDFRRLP